MLRPLYALQVYALLHKLPQWAHFPELGHMPHCQLHSSVNFSSSCESAYSKPATQA